MIRTTLNLAKINSTNSYVQYVDSNIIKSIESSNIKKISIKVTQNLMKIESINLHAYHSKMYHKKR